MAVRICFGSFLWGTKPGQNSMEVGLLPIDEKPLYVLITVRIQRWGLIQFGSNGVAEMEMAVSKNDVFILFEWDGHRSVTRTNDNFFMQSVQNTLMFICTVQHIVLVSWSRLQTESLNLLLKILWHVKWTKCHSLEETRREKIALSQSKLSCTKGFQKLIGAVFFTRRSGFLLFAVALILKARLHSAVCPS